MKSLLSISVAVFVLTPALFADENKSSNKPTAACCDEKAKTTCASAKGSCCTKEAAALRQALLTHKGGWIVQR